MRWYVNKQNWRHSQNSYRVGVHHYLVISLNLTQLSLHTKPCGCRRTFQQVRIRVPAGRDCQVILGELRFQMILECRCALTEMPPFVVAMEQRRCGLWRPRAADDAGDDDDDSVDVHCSGAGSQDGQDVWHGSVWAHLPTAADHRATAARLQLVCWGQEGEVFKHHAALTVSLLTPTCVSRAGRWSVQAPCCPDCVTVVTLCAVILLSV